MICLHWLSLVLACVACALIGAGYGAILGAERSTPRRGSEGITATACAFCLRDVRRCSCAMKRRVGQA